MSTSRAAVRGVAAVVLAVCCACGNSASLGSNSRVGQRGARGNGSKPSRPRRLAECTRIETFKKQPARHIPIGHTYRHYDSSPPTSGPHWPISADPGFHTVELPPEELVHNLEHGQIVVWYDPDITSETQSALERLVARNPGAIVAAPSETIRPPYEFVLTAWGASQSCERASTAVIDHFRHRFQGRGPEDVGVPTFPKEE